MEALVLNKQFVAVAVLDSFESMLWTDRYNKCGDFEVVLPMSSPLQKFLLLDYYLYNKDSEHMMITESVEVKSDLEDGNKLIVTGRSLESILDRRIIWTQTSISGNLQNGVKKLINENIISPVITERRIANFVFEDSDDPRITELEIPDTQYTGDTIYEIVCSLCEKFEIGFKITLNANLQFVFKLYKGADRSYDQTENPYVTFSQGFENIINSDYVESKSNYKNVTLVAGEGEGTARKTATVGSATELDRRELYTDARDLSQTENNVTYSDEKYRTMLQERGTEHLLDYKVNRVFDGEVETQYMFKYGKDFFLGDIVQVKSVYGTENKSRVVEMIFSHETKGISYYPGFEILDHEEEVE